MAAARQAIAADVPEGSTAQAAASSAAETEALRPAVLAPHLSEEAVNERFETLLRHVQSNRPNEDVTLIRKAWEFCVQHHNGQMRASGEPYIIHPLEVAEVLTEMRMDATAIAAGLL